MRGKTALVVCALALVSTALSLADEWNRKINVTFSKPVSIPAVHQPGWGVLPPGTYVFKIADSSSNRHIVQIFNKDENQIYATILAVPDTRLNVTSDVVITFRETAAGQPAALRAMFYPGRAWGEEFVYPKAKATELAKATSQPVLSMPAAMEKEVAQPEAPEVLSELAEIPLTAVKPSGEEVEIAEVTTLPTVGEIKAGGLPKTASPLPLIGLTGFFLLAAGSTFRLAARRIR